MPPLVATTDELESMLAILQQALDDVTKSRHFTS
jgi:adenosylmethionine-8-amino-7-oxononanoate aminotransferase